MSKECQWVGVGRSWWGEAAGVNSGTVVTGHEGEAGGKLKTFMEG